MRNVHQRLEDHGVYFLIKGILEEIAIKGSFPVKLGLYVCSFGESGILSGLLHHWFWGTAHSGCFIILSTLFILILHKRKVFKGKHSSMVDF